MAHIKGYPYKQYRCCYCGRFVKHGIINIAVDHPKTHTRKQKEFELMDTMIGMYNAKMDQANRDLLEYGKAIAKDKKGSY